MCAPLPGAAPADMCGAPAPPGDAAVWLPAMNAGGAPASRISPNVGAGPALIAPKAAAARRTSGGGDPCAEPDVSPDEVLAAAAYPSAVTAGAPVPSAAPG